MFEDKHITMKEVAREAGVSRAAVSLVINKKHRQARISERTAMNIQTVLNKSGYTPNAFASSLRRQKSRTIGIVIGDSLYPNEIETIQVMIANIRKRDYHVFLSLLEKGSNQWEFTLKSLRGQKVEGIIVSSSCVPLGDWEENSKHIKGIPSVILTMPEDSNLGKVSYVSTNRLVGAYTAVQHLINLGHKRIAFLCGPVETFRYPNSQMKTEGYIKALADAGIPYDENLLAHCAANYHGGQQAIERILNLKPRPTAIFAISDILAIGAIRGIHENGLHVPDDIAVVGFDNIEASAYAEKPLTTVEQPSYELGTNGIDLLFDFIEGREKNIREILIPPRLVIRESCGANLKYFTGLNLAEKEVRLEGSVL